MNKNYRGNVSNEEYQRIRNGNQGDIFGAFLFLLLTATCVYGVYDYATHQKQEQSRIQKECGKGTQGGQAPKASPSDRVQHAAPRLQV